MQNFKLAVERLGTGYGYYVNATKSWLVVKEDYFDEACSLFAGTSLRITTEGCPYLGAPLGSQEFHSTLKVSQWEHDIMQLSKFASSQPHATYSAMIHGYHPVGHFYPLAAGILDLAETCPTRGPTEDESLGCQPFISPQNLWLSHLFGTNYQGRAILRTRDWH